MWLSLLLCRWFGYPTQIWIIGHIIFNINSITLSDNALARYITVKSADISQCSIDCIDDDTCNAFAGGLAENSCFLFLGPVSYTFQKTGSEMYWDRECLNISSRIRTSMTTPTLSSATLAVL